MKRVSLGWLRFLLVLCRVGLVASRVLDLLMGMEGMAFIWVCWAYAQGYESVVDAILRWGMWAVYAGAVCVMLRWLAIWLCRRYTEDAEVSRIDD